MKKLNLVQRLTFIGGLALGGCQDYLESSKRLGDCNDGTRSVTETLVRKTTIMGAEIGSETVSEAITRQECGRKTYQSRGGYCFGFSCIM